MKKVLLIYNRISGTGFIRKNLAVVVEEFVKNDCEVTVYPIFPKKGIVTEKIIAEESSRFDLIVICGGDGTLNYAINALMKHNIQKPIGYIPSGTTNDFSKNIENATTIEGFCHNIIHGTPFTYDIGKLNHRYFNYVAAFGAFTKASYATSQSAKNTLGYGAYVLNSIGTFGESLNYHRHVHLSHDGIEEEGDYIFGSITNSLTMGGLKLPFLQDAKLNDGLFEVLLVSAPKDPADFANIIGNIATGNFDNQLIHSFQTKEIEITCMEKLGWTIDGEDGGCYQNNHFKVIDKAITIIR